MAAEPKIGLIKAQNSKRDILGTNGSYEVKFCISSSFNGLHLRG